MTSATASPAEQLQEVRDLLASYQMESTNGQNRESQWPEFQWVRSAQKTETPNIDHARIVIFQANHGFAKLLPGGFNDYARQIVSGESRLNRLCQSSNVDLRLYEMDIENPTQNAVEGVPSMDLDETVKSIAYGMMAVEPGLNLIAASAFGQGSEISAKAILQAHGIAQFDDINCARLLKTNGGAKGFECLSAIGGFEIAALCGVIIAARLANIPVFAETYAAAAALAILSHEQADFTHHCALAGPDVEKLGQGLKIASYAKMSNAAPAEALAYYIPILRNDLIMMENSAKSAAPHVHYAAN